MARIEVVVNDVRFVQRGDDVDDRVCPGADAQAAKRLMF
jgi:hypothetical protein